MDSFSVVFRQMKCDFPELRPAQWTTHPRSVAFTVTQNARQLVQTQKAMLKNIFLIHAFHQTRRVYPSESEVFLVFIRPITIA